MKKPDDLYVTLSPAWLSVLLVCYPRERFPIQKGKVNPAYDRLFYLDEADEPRPLNIDEFIRVASRLSDQTISDFGLESRDDLVRVLSALPNLTYVLNTVIEHHDQGTPAPVADYNEIWKDVPKTVLAGQTFENEHSLVDYLQKRLRDHILAYRPAKLFGLFETKSARVKRQQSESLAELISAKNLQSVSSIRSAMMNWSSKNKAFTMSRQLFPWRSTSPSRSALLLQYVEARLREANQIKKWSGLGKG